MPNKSSGEPALSFTRRGFLQSAAAAAAVTHLPPGVAAESGPGPAPIPLAPAQQVSLNINGKQQKLTIEPRVTLLDALREYAGLTGSKKGCDRGQCGACTVLVNDRRINACLTLAISHEGDSIVTIEGVAEGDRLAPIQAAFLEYDAFQCGYCTPGQICSAIACVDELKAGTASAVSPDVRVKPLLTDDEIRERMSGNLCRCGAYPNIVIAIRSIAATKA